MDNQTERERIIKEITSRMDWTVQDIEKIAEWHISEVNRILEPLKNHMNNNAQTFGEGRQQAIDECLKRANGGN